MFVEREFIPVILGGDINTYSVARALYSCYQVKSYVFGKYPTGPSYESKIINYEANVKIEDDEYFLERINSFAKEHSDKKIILIGCGDSYVALCSKHKNSFRKNVISPYIDFDLMDRLQHKDTFYKLCDKYHIEYPKTFIYERKMNNKIDLDFDYPVILKPADSIQYWEYPFSSQKKVYKISDSEELYHVLDLIYSSGYKGKMIIQDMIPGNDESMYVLTSYSDSYGKVKLMCLGHVLLEEHTPHGLGNHAVIITEYQHELIDKVRMLLEELSYTGFSNFDIKYDSRDGKFKFFEINTRQGRSNYYVTATGNNISKYLIDDYIYHKKQAFKVVKDKYLWWVVPRGVAYKYVKNENNIKEMKMLVHDKKCVNPIFMKGDYGLRRLIRMLKLYFKHYLDFRKYYK